ncbi:vegetative incompatibility protein het-e-1 [Plakobranchus ocellatus]|uniref:Vegetative incompatibility protein het-e-1 n=1 Tax=Plakobranchus ocellatus TaxID=259542 RepID=A0AAV3YM87_9GAST|nr:vegetative incompatibility protein het-e-1 [Plakobranchus ocellatus]
MERQYVVRDTHTRSITAVGYNPIRREIVLGCEDGVVKSWEAESGKLVQTFYQHRGWVTDFLFWGDAKLMLSSSNDAQIIAWGTGGGAVDVIPVSVPVYCMAINPRRQQLVCGVNEGVRVYALDEEKESGHCINNRLLYFAQEHTDIVRCIICHESRIYSAGYDQRLVIYDSSYTGDNSLTPVLNNVVHDAGIACLVLAKDNENNTWLLTGSFDKSLKIWSIDGKLIHKLDTFLSTVSGICYVPRNKTVWAAGGTFYASMFDPKSGDNVSDFIGTFSTQEEEKYHLQIIKFFPELNQVVASTSRRHMIVWKYNSSGCVTTLTCKSPMESLCYTSKVPILLFSGDHDGAIIKWERMQSNHFMYSKEKFTLSDSKMKKKKRAGSKARELMLEQEQGAQQARPETKGESAGGKKIQSHYAFNKPILPPISSHKHPNTTILKIIFVESMDYILAASEDSNVYVWGFDDAAVQVLQNMKPQDQEMLTYKYAVLLDPDSGLLPSNANSAQAGNDSVTNRVAGFILKFVLSEHLSCVTSLVLVGRDHGVEGTYVISGSWDRRICLWDLEAGQLKDIFKIDSNSTSFRNEMACDDIITDMDFSPKNMEFAYSCADKMVYIRKFSLTGSKMTLTNTLQGHEAEVTCIKWNSICNKWVTGSEDGTVRIWSSHGMNECEQVLFTQGSVTCVCVDQVHGSIVAGVQRDIKVYDSEHYRLVQSNVGHTDSVRTILHIPERSQYISCGWDETIRVWNAWKMPRRRRPPKSEKSEKRRGSRKHSLILEDGGRKASKEDIHKIPGTIQEEDEGEKGTGRIQSNHEEEE